MRFEGCCIFYMMCKLEIALKDTSTRCFTGAEGQRGNNVLRCLWNCTNCKPNLRRGLVVT